MHALCRRVPVYLFNTIHNCELVYGRQSDWIWLFESDKHSSCSKLFAIMHFCSWLAIHVCVRRCCFCFANKRDGITSFMHAVFHNHSVCYFLLVSIATEFDYLNRTNTSCSKLFAIMHFCSWLAIHVCVRRCCFCFANKRDGKTSFMHVVF